MKGLRSLQECSYASETIIASHQVRIKVPRDLFTLGSVHVSIILPTISKYHIDLSVVLKTRLLRNGFALLFLVYR